jgi:hypothetical protein
MKRKQPESPRKGQPQPPQPAVTLDGVVVERIVKAAHRMATAAERIAQTLRPTASVRCRGCGRKVN